MAVDTGAHESASPAANTVDGVFDALGAAVLGYLRTAGADDSEDVLSEVFVRVARGLGRFSGDARAQRRWVFTIAHNCLMDEHRRRSRQRRLLARLTGRPTLAMATEPGDPFDPELRRALLALTDEQREVVTLRFVADLSLDEVARITGRPVGAIKSLQHRALGALASRLS